MAYDNNAFCWHGLVSTDVDKALDFYPKVVGWSVQTMSMGDSEATMFAAADIPRAHVSAPDVPGQASHWNNYLRVEDVDATTAAAVANGGTQVVPPMDIPPGRFSMVASPSGAVLSVYHEADADTAANAPSGDGAVHWVELHSHDVDADLAWLTATFGFKISQMDMGGNGTYHLLNDGDTHRGGVMKAQNAQAPSMWMTWFQVPDADAAVATAKAEGGQAITELMDMPGIGRMAVLADTTGGVFGIIKPSEA